MNIETNPQQKALVREQFTRTAEVFGDFAVATRVDDAEQLAHMVSAGPSDRAADLACGPGTLALRFAGHVRWIFGLDLTPTILERAKRAAAKEGLHNLDFAIGDAQSLPLADGSLDIAVASYSLHHLPDAPRAIGEMARVVKRGGRVGILDIFVPEDPHVADLNNRIERLRDASHTRTLFRGEYEANFAAHGLRVLGTRIEEHSRAFDHWMLVAGWKPGDRQYVEARRLLENSMPDDSAFFHPRFQDSEKGGQSPELYFINTVLFIAGEKI